MEQLFCRMDTRTFAGAVDLANHLPSRYGILDCSLWVVSEMLWGKKDPFLLAESWFYSHHPDWNFHAFSEELRNIRQIVVQVNELKSMTSELGRDAISSEEGKAVSESLLARLKEWELKWEREKGLARKRRRCFKIILFLLHGMRAGLSFTFYNYLIYPFQMCCNKKTGRTLFGPNFRKAEDKESVRERSLFWSCLIQDSPAAAFPVCLWKTVLYSQ